MTTDRVPLLDHGYLQLVEFWGSDERIVAAARMSTDKGFQGWGPTRCVCVKQESLDNPARILQATIPESIRAADENFNTMANYCDADPECKKCGGKGEIAGDEKLLRYLWEHKHLTPFEMAGATFEIQAPLFVFREWHRHRTQSYNELSARFTALPDLYYVPSLERIMAGGQGHGNKQSSGALIDRDVAVRMVAAVTNAYAAQRQLYVDLMLDGLARELARIVVPVGQYSRMRASANLRNWLAFLDLRMEPSAQWEIRQYAEALCGSLCAIFPRTLSLFAEG